MPQLKIRSLPFYAAAMVCLLPAISSPSALVIGLLIANLGLVPQSFPLGKVTKKLLAISIVGLGFGIQLDEALQATGDGILLIIASILLTLILGVFLYKQMKIDDKLGYLIASGTAICGGSAIAAVSPAIKAQEQQIGLALATVFVLNSIALFLFPMIGHALDMDQVTFGTWAAIAIHDTSSVVGAASAYGEEALKIATTLKLARALWIIPLVVFSAWYFKTNNTKFAVPGFIVLYCIAILISDNLPQFNLAYETIFNLAKRLLVLCLFFVGASITFERIKVAGAKPLIMGLILWAAISISSLTWLILVD